MHPRTMPSPEPKDFLEDAILMIDNLRREKTEGFVMDMITYWLFQTLAQNILSTTGDKI